MAVVLNQPSTGTA